MYNSNVILKFFYIFGNEIRNFIAALSVDKNHTRNITYVTVSIFSNTQKGMLFNALLLFDIINKIKTLNQVLSIFNENKIALGSTLALFGVLLYICAFFSF